MTEHQEATQSKILIVEDEGIIALDLKSCVEQLGYAVLACVDSAEKALELAEQEPPDLVLMDIVLKGQMDGIEAAVLMHSRWGIPVIFITAYPDLELVERAKQVTPFGYILKPFQDNEIKAHIEIALYTSRVDKERKKAEEALKGKTRLNQILLDAFPCVALLLRPQTREIIASNAAAVRVGAVPGTHCFSTWGQRDDPCPWCLAPAMWATGEAQHLEVEALGITWDAHWIPVEENLYMHFALDITERKRTETRLIESEEKYRSLASTDDSMYLVDKESRFRFMNDVHLKRLNTTLDEVIGRSYGEFHSEEDTKQFAGIVKEVFETNTSVQVEHKSEREPKYFLRTFSPVRDPQGRVTAVTVISKDITERKRAEEALLDSRNMLQTVLDSIPSAVFWKDCELIYLGGNRTWLEAAGLKSTGEVEGKSDYDLPWEKEQADSFREDDKRVIESGIPEYNIIEPYLRADGIQAWARTNKVPLRDKKGNVTGVLGTYEDITESKQAEENLRIYQKQLQSLAIRLSEVEEAERKEIARTLHDLVGQNLTALSLNLTIILGMISEDQNPFLVSRLEDSQKLLEDTTQHIREVMSELRPSVLDDFGLIAALRWYGQRFNRMTGIQTNVEGKKISPRLPPSLETIIFRIAQEALTNVLKHASAGKVDLRLEKVEDRVQLTIMDDGRGFIFKGFRSGGKKRGWGLTMMRERAVALGGDLQIYSEPGKGTRVILQLPGEI